MLNMNNMYCTGMSLLLQNAVYTNEQKSVFTFALTDTPIFVVLLFFFWRSFPMCASQRQKIQFYIHRTGKQYPACNTMLKGGRFNSKILSFSFFH